MREPGGDEQGRPLRIWVDLDNAPHVLVLGPLVRRFEAAGHHVQITARESGDTIPLLELHDLPFLEFGRHAGRRPWRKALELLTRSVALTRFARSEAFDLVVCHGARGVVLPAVLRRVPLVYLTDYEHAFVAPFRLWARLTLVPDVMPDAVLREQGFDLGRVSKFPGLKEEFYIYDFEPDPSILDDLGVDSAKVMVVVRPPATTAHYHVSETDELFAHAMNHLIGRDGVQVVLLPRDAKQRQKMRREYPAVIMPDRPVNGANLLWHADMVVGAGGTMNREAACLGVPVYSLFRGKIGAVDRHLEAEGRMRLLTSLDEVEAMVVEKRQPVDLSDCRRKSADLVDFVTRRILEVV